MKKIGKYIIITEDEEFKFFKFMINVITECIIIARNQGIHIARGQHDDASKCRDELENMNKKWVDFYCKTFGRK